MISRRSKSLVSHNVGAAVRFLSTHVRLAFLLVLIAAIYYARSPDLTEYHSSETTSSFANQTLAHDGSTRFANQTFVYNGSVPFAQQDQLLNDFLDTHLIQLDSASDANNPGVVVIDKTANVSAPRENATFLILCRNNELYELMETIQSVQDRFNHLRHYDYTFLNDEPFTREFIVELSHYIPHGKLNFGRIPTQHWSYPSWIDQDLARQCRWELQQRDVVYATSESYRHMCRWYSGFFYKHPLVRQYRYYWRLEPGVKLYCDLHYDVFTWMKQRGKRYGFVLSMFEYQDTIETLWDTFKQFARHTEPATPNLMQFVENDDQYASYNLCHFWTNFEVAEVSVFDNANYQAYFDHLDKSGGFFYERWGDAPVHSLAVSYFLKPSEVWWFEDVGYWHAPYLQCPQSKSVRRAGSCSCDPNEDFTDSFLSCTNHLLKLTGQTLGSAPY